MNEPINTPTDQPKEQPTSGFTPFTAAQQLKLDQIVKDAMSRSGREARQALEAEKQRAAQLDADLAAAQQALTATATERDSEKNARVTMEQQAIKWRKDAYIAGKCVDFGFIDAPTVSALVEGNLVWNEATQDFDVINDHSAAQSVTPPDSEDDEDSEERSATQPVTPDAFFAQFALRKPYLVKSDVHSGAGSGDSTRTGLSTGRQVYKIEDIFGRASNSRLANELARSNPAEYKRLKREAQNKRLI